MNPNISLKFKEDSILKRNDRPFPKDPVQGDYADILNEPDKQFKVSSIGCDTVDFETIGDKYAGFVS